MYIFFHVILTITSNMMSKHEYSPLSDKYSVNNEYCFSISYIPIFHGVFSILKNLFVAYLKFKI